MAQSTSCLKLQPQETDTCKLAVGVKCIFKLFVYTFGISQIVDVVLNFTQYKCINFWNILQPKQLFIKHQTNNLASSNTNPHSTKLKQLHSTSQKNCIQPQNKTLCKKSALNFTQTRIEFQPYPSQTLNLNCLQKGNPNKNPHLNIDLRKIVTTKDTCTQLDSNIDTDKLLDLVGNINKT